MPIARTPALQSQHWIPRVAEDEFVALLNDKKPYVLPVMGVGGAGKSSLLRRFFSYCEQQQIPVLYIDLPRLKASTALDIWLQLEVANAPQFTKTRKKLHSSYESLSAILPAILN